MSISTAMRALIQSLKAEGTAGASWGQNVYLTEASSVVQLSGPATGSPVVLQWPCLLLTGPAIKEDKGRRQAPGAARERLGLDVDAGTATVRPWPRFVDLAVGCEFQTRVGVTSGISATDELLTAIDRFGEWAMRTPKLDTPAVNLFMPQILSSANARRPSPADIRSAVGSLLIQGVAIYSAPAETVPITQTIEVTTEIDTEGVGGETAQTTDVTFGR